MIENAIVFKPFKYVLNKVLFVLRTAVVLVVNRTERLKEKDSLCEDIIVNLSHHHLRRPLLNDEKVDIVFIFQAASFWASWESIWDACINDNRFNAIMLVCDDDIKEKIQFKTAREFLRKKEIPFRHVSEVNLSDINPHIIVLHTPYDGHRPRYLHGKRLSSKGYRTVYITYGIEISDSEKARKDHFTGGVTTSAWRVYTFSKKIIRDYKLLSPTGGDMVRAFGHPKFDYLNKKNFPALPDEINHKANGRKIILWKVHFPKEVNFKMITPSLKIYEELLNNLHRYKNLFFIFMPHPKFYEKLVEFGNVRRFQNKVSALENVYEFSDDDYRPVLMNCDYYITDRSALMVEAGVTGKPILYISTKSPEPMTEPIQAILDSYYQAMTYSDIKHFIDNVVIKNSDPLKEKRAEVFNSIIPDIDGNSGYKIKEDMFNSLKAEPVKF